MILSCRTAFITRRLLLTTLSRTSGKQRTSTARKLLGILRIVSVVVSEGEHTTCVCDVCRHTCDALYLAAETFFVAVII